MKTRKFIIITILYFFSVLLLITASNNGAGMVCILALLFLSGIFLEGKRLVLFVLIDIVVFVILTILLMTGMFDQTLMFSYKGIWPINMLTTQICGIGLLFLTNIIYKALEKQAESIKASKVLIEASENRYRSIFINAGLGIFNLSLDGRITNANDRCLEILGYSLKELNELFFREIIYVDDIAFLDSVFAKIINKDIKLSNTEARCYQKNGTVIWTNITLVLTENLLENLSFFVCTIEDITENKALIEKNLNLEAYLRNQQKLEAIGTLAGGVAHEINNPLNGIMNYAQLIQDYANSAEDVIGYSGEILNETERIATIVKNLLQFSRNDRRHHSYSKIEDIINSTSSLIKTIMQHDQISFTVEISKNIPKLKCRNQQIQQVIMNLLTNARDSLNEKYKGYHEDKILRVNCMHFIKGPHNWIRITVEDHGNGIDNNIQTQIFDPFFTTKTRDEGTGLGLSISYGIVKDHHGELTYESEKGKYTRFFLDLPCDNGWETE